MADIRIVKVKADECSLYSAVSWIIDGFMFKLIEERLTDSLVLERIAMCVGCGYSAEQENQYGDHLREAE
jgi:hypothetical protein